MSPTKSPKLVVIEASDGQTHYTRYVGRTRTASLALKEPLSKDEVNLLRHDPTLFGDPGAPLAA